MKLLEVKEQELALLEELVSEKLTTLSNEWRDAIYKEQKFYASVLGIKCDELRVLRAKLKNAV